MMITNELAENSTVVSASSRPRLELMNDVLHAEVTMGFETRDQSMHLDSGKIGHKRTKMHSWQRPFEHVETRPCVDCAPLQRHLSTPCPSWLSPGASLQTCSSAIHNVRTCRAAQTQHRLTCSYSERKVSTAGIPPEMSVVLPAPDV